MKRRRRSPWLARVARPGLLLAALASCAAAPAPGAVSATTNTGAEPTVAPATAAAAPAIDPALLAARLAACPDEIAARVAEGGELIHLGTHQDVDVVRVVAGSADSIVAVGALRVPGQAGPVACAVQHPVANAGALSGRFWPGREAVEALLLGPKECSPEHCPGTILVRGRGPDEPLGAVFLAETCNRTRFLDPLRWFDGQDSLQLTCHQSAGAAHREILFILHVTRRGLAPILRLETGMAEAASLEERETPGFCERRPVGWVRVIEKGARPVVRVLDPGRGHAGRDGQGTALEVDLRFDPDQGRFEPISSGTLRDYDARAWCR